MSTYSLVDNDNKPPQPFVAARILLSWAAVTRSTSDARECTLRAATVCARRRLSASAPQTELTRWRQEYVRPLTAVRAPGAVRAPAGRQVPPGPGVARIAAHPR